MDMGIEAYLLADSLVGVIAQRLVRRLCNNCKRSRKASEAERKLLEAAVDEELDIYEPVGCPLCNDTGYLGRTGVYEIMVITPNIRQAIANKGSSVAIQELAIREGMNTLKMSTAEYVKKGITSIAELKKIIYED
jgi:type IV pilus assembly protein PilB